MFPGGVCPQWVESGPYARCLHRAESVIATQQWLVGCQRRTATGGPKHPKRLWAMHAITGHGFGGSWKTAPTVFPRQDGQPKVSEGSALENLRKSETCHQVMIVARPGQ